MIERRMSASTSFLRMSILNSDRGLLTKARPTKVTPLMIARRGSTLWLNGFTNTMKTLRTDSPMKAPKAGINGFTAVLTTLKKL